MDGAFQAKAQRGARPRQAEPRDGWRGPLEVGPGKLLSNPELPWQRSPVRLAQSDPPTPPTQCPTSGGAPDTSQTESGWDGRLMRGCPEWEGSGTEMKDRCHNCNRQPVSNALAASISEPASHGSRLDEAWADGWLPEPWGGSPLADCTWDKRRS